MNYEKQILFSFQPSADGNRQPVQADLQSGCAEKGIYNPQPDLMKKDSIILGFEQFIIIFDAK